MKVICIDASPGFRDRTIKPTFKEGDELEVEEIEYDGFIKLCGHKYSWHPRRFIPLSSIDETTFERNYNKEAV